ncbi:hypothetical protein [Calothrix sp. UHCC 0171]|uniref:hypothetical protein n=1 Tax=Calothrix sp. UHCC 0171 TaxID=3110245 RepID=UPI002B21383E|nr:hypothetical protein [Calothrix sp. UHCC 0171]MEA5569672.1 hypothetical protein [Calothrix sp. UHCC 0171]
MDFNNNNQHLPLQLFIFILSLADDVLLLGLARVGIHFAWLRWLSPVIIGGMIVHMGWHFYRHRIKKRAS